MKMCGLHRLAVRNKHFNIMEKFQTQKSEAFVIGTQTEGAR